MITIKVARPYGFDVECKKAFDDVDDSDPEQLTKRMRIVVRAIGAFPNHPPEWALRFCSECYEAMDQAPGGLTRMLDASKTLHRGDGELLDAITLHMLLHKSSLHGAARAVTGDETNGANIKRLMRKFKKERAEEDPWPMRKRTRRAYYKLATRK